MVQHHSKNPDLIEATKRLFKDVETLAVHFPKDVPVHNK